MFTTACLQWLFPERVSKTLVAAANEDSVHQLLQPRILPHGVALLPYQEPLIAALIKEVKYYHNKRAIALLANCVAHYLEKTYPNQSLTLVPVPLSSTRERERGYNQVTIVLEQLLAKNKNYHLCPALKRVRHTRQQTKLTRSDRTKNVRDAFVLSNIPTSTDVVLLFDDVLTTGATITEASQTLGLPHRTLLFSYAC